MNKELETKLLLQDRGYSEYEIEEITEEYLPEVKKHIGFYDGRRDKRFVVKFHDICFFTNTPEDMSEDEFNNLFDIFCNEQYEMTKDYIEEECWLTEQQIFGTHDVGHYRAFEYVLEEELTEENLLEVTEKIYDEGLSPNYIHDYVKIANYLQSMEDNYMENWLEFLRCYVDNECVNITDATIKNIERRWKEYEAKHNPKK